MCVDLSRVLVTGLAVGFLMTGMACAQKSQPAQTAESAPRSQPAQTTGTAAGVTWTAPAGWAVQPTRPMRVATYNVPAAAGDQEAGECAVYFFGAGQGGDVESNISRWQSQFEGPSGKTPDLNLQKSEINGLSVTTMSITGTYLASMGPMVQAGATKKEGYRMLGAIIAAPEGNVFIKFTGPEKTVTAAEKDFKAMVDSIRK